MLTPVTLHLHAWLRWVLLALALVVLVRAVRGWRGARGWAPLDDRMMRVFVGLGDLQLLAGLLMMLWTSPLVEAAWQAGLSAMLEQPALLVFGLVHPLGMFVAIAIIHAAHGRAQQIEGPRRHRTVAIGVVAWFVVVLALIPWPFLPWGRPLVRLGTAEASAPASPRELPPPLVFAARCALCHGSRGAGDGPASAGLVPRPRTFGDPGWQRASSDTRLRAAIFAGGASIGLSAAMPAHGDLSPAELDGLVAFIRSLDPGTP